MVYTYYYHSHSSTCENKILILLNHFNLISTIYMYNAVPELLWHLNALIQEEVFVYSTFHCNMLICEPLKKNSLQKQIDYIYCMVSVYSTKDLTVD